MLTDGPRLFHSYCEEGRCGRGRDREPGSHCRTHRAKASGGGAAGASVAIRIAYVFYHALTRYCRVGGLLLESKECSLPTPFFDWIDRKDS